MCLVAVAFGVHRDVPLVVAANRDEWRDRPAAALSFWSDHPTILAGRDLAAGGTWMGITRTGRFAAVTNYRDPSERRSMPRSRGALVTDALLSPDPPEVFLRSLEPSDYAGFNLLVGDERRLFYYSSREGEPREVLPGVHGLSNHLLDEPWPKVLRARAAIAEAPPDDARIFAMLSDTNIAPDDELPDTNVGLAWERRLSPPLITGDDYGTRTSTILRVGRAGSVHVEERTRDATGNVSRAVTVEFDVTR
jgi:uncharacterized protein with NRDE domain